MTNLEDKLRQWRRETAQEENVPAFRVLTDATLMEIARARPATVEDLPAIPGLGPVKVERYGSSLVSLVEHDEGLPLPPPPNPEWLDELAAQMDVVPEVFQGFRLAERTASVLARRLGLHDGRRWTVAEVAELLSLSPPKVSQLEVQGLGRLVGFLLSTDRGTLVPRVLTAV